MNPVAIQLDQTLRRLEPERRAELERLVFEIMRPYLPSAYELEQAHAEWLATVSATEGSLPDFPDDIDENGAWRIDPISGQRRLIG